MPVVCHCLRLLASRHAVASEKKMSQRTWLSIYFIIRHAMRGHFVNSARPWMGMQEPTWAPMAKCEGSIRDQPCVSRYWTISHCMRPSTRGRRAVAYSTANPLSRCGDRSNVLKIDPFDTRIQNIKCTLYNLQKRRYLDGQVMIVIWCDVSM